MISKSYYSNIKSKNILNDSTSKTLSNELASICDNSHFDNMILNSNLESQNTIK